MSRYIGMTDRRARPLLSTSLRPLAPLAFVWLAGALILTAVLVQQGVPYADLLLDPATTGKLPWYTGLVSNLGVLGWAVGTTVAAGGAWMARRGGRPGAAWFLARGAAISLALLADDLFQLHVVITAAFGIPKRSFYGAYLVAVAWWLVTDRAEIRRTRWPLLGAAGAALGSSVLVDQLATGSELTLLAEDAAKFLGILAWSTYFCTSVADIASSILAPLGALRRSPGTSPESAVGTDHGNGPNDPGQRGRIRSSGPGGPVKPSVPSDEVAVEHVASCSTVVPERGRIRTGEP